MELGPRPPLLLLSAAVRADRDRGGAAELQDGSHIDGVLSQGPPARGAELPRREADAGGGGAVGYVRRRQVGERNQKKPEWHRCFFISVFLVMYVPVFCGIRGCIQMQTRDQRW